MSEVKHTPGPWEIHQSDRMDKAHVVHGFSIRWKECPGVLITDIYPGKTTDRIEPIAKANARLIAAAPDLLADLKSCLAIVEQYLEESGPCDHAVNICVCGIRSVADDAREHIKQAEAHDAR